MEEVKEEVVETIPTEELEVFEEEVLTEVPVKEEE